ncbi:MAG: hypothetical protein RQ866_03865, partial [Bacteroidales bacterium]|nr:hypothetical protein [Bacteroidales bacterium]
HTEATEGLISSFMLPMVEAGVDQIVLGCTHYPFLIPVIKKIAPPGLTIHDPSPAVARQAHRLLESHEIKAASLLPDHRFITSGSEMRLRKMLEHLNIMNPTVTKVAPF